MATTTEMEVRVVKRQKLDSHIRVEQNRSAPTRSNIFAPFRTVGLVSPTAVPFTSVPLGKTTFQITTCIGRSLQTYDLQRGLQLVFITSPETPGAITATASLGKNVVAAWKHEKRVGLWMFKRGKKVAEFEASPGQHASISQLLVFGPWIVGCSQNSLEVWKSDTMEHYTTIHSRSTGKAGGFSGQITTMPTYLNKVFAGKQDGTVEIWNISTGKLIYSILPASSNYGSVTALQPTPALSLLAIAYASGPLIIQDVRADKPVLSFNTGNDSRLSVTAISFRTDGAGAGEDGRKAGVMATTSRGAGDITFWDLNKGGKKMSVLRGAHSPPSMDGTIPGGISNIEFLPGQAVLVSSGLDNALKTWIFDEIPFSPIPRILHSRGGHAASVSTLKFLPGQSEGSENDGKWLMSASHDRSFWGWSLRRDAQSSELSQGNIRKKARKAGLLNSSLDLSERGTSLEELKAPRITSIACSLNRDGGIGAMPGNTSIWSNDTTSKSKNPSSSFSTGWESVVTGHVNDPFARTWFWGRKRAGRWKFKTSDGTNVTSVTMSSCGTFALIGSAGGLIDMYNLQSGIHRQRFPTKLTPPQIQRLQTSNPMFAQNSSGSRKFAHGEGKHAAAITGIEVDSLNKTVISCGADGKVKFWEFSTGMLLSELDWSLTSIGGMRFHRPSDLIALSCDDGSIRVVDIDTRKLVRELWGAKGSILDFTFSNDGRWIISSAGDSIVRVYDLATGHLIEALRFRSQPTAVAFSPTGEYLATALADSVGVHIWTNRSLFTHVPTRQIGPNDIIDIDAPSPLGAGGAELIDTVTKTAANPDGDETDDSALSKIDQLSSDLLTLSLVPKAKWQTLLHLDTIRARNKPKEAPKKPQAAPFFLPSLEKKPNGISADSALIPNEPTAGSRISKIANPTVASTSTFTSLLQTFTTTSDPAPLFAHLAALPPSAIDVAIRTIDPAPPYTECVAFIRALTARLAKRRDYELVQTWMAVFLRCHANIVTESSEIKEALQAWRAEAEKEGKRVGEMIGYVRGVVGWVGGVV
ncbi:Utp21-domain-containing protein [Microthyrium microscopicum]|uniref:Utp21-domain-containing protein n=1 Tax=Microthyrium microscopicum TaxID=703497 RepID=A0A6A6TVS3_9PEZI|nr:Utp21-domain-containing protein [Microthyrium microscopicum]